MNINIWKGVWIMILWYNMGCKKNRMEYCNYEFFYGKWKIKFFL